jgi:hypothetical protein
MAKKESSTSALVKKAKSKGKATKHPNKHKSTKPYKSQGR